MIAVVALVRGVVLAASSVVVGVVDTPSHRLKLKVEVARLGMYRSDTPTSKAERSSLLLWIHRFVAVPAERVAAVMTAVLPMLWVLLLLIGDGVVQLVRAV